MLIVVAPTERFRQFFGRNCPRVLLLEQHKEFLETQEHLTTIAGQKIAWLIQCLILKVSIKY
jgi:hypothetical protein